MKLTLKTYHELINADTVKDLTWAAFVGKELAIVLTKGINLKGAILVFKRLATQTSNGCITCVLWAGNVSSSMLCLAKSQKKYILKYISFDLQKLANHISKR